MTPGPARTKPRPVPSKTIVLQFPEERLPEAPEYELFDPPIGQGGFGKVWIARNAIGQYEALKAVYQSKFGENTKPYETEFHGLKKYKPISEKQLITYNIIPSAKMSAWGVPGNSTRPRHGLPTVVTLAGRADSRRRE